MNKRKLLSSNRYADPDTVDHIIELRKQLAQAIIERDNALDRCVMLEKSNRKLNDQIWWLSDPEKWRNP